MKTKHLKAAGAAVSLLIASGPALATSTGPEFLGASPVTLDAFTFTCPAGTVSARARVSDQFLLNLFPVPPSFFNVPARMRVILTKAAPFPPAAAQVEDVNPAANGGEGLVPGPFGSPSAWATVFGGAGSYRAMFLKTDAGAERYAGDIECVLFGGGIFNPALPLNPQQNQ